MVEFGMGDAGACTHHLHIACGGAALIAGAVLVGDCATAYIGDDLHVTMRMRIKSRMWLDDIIIYHQQFTKTHPVRVLVAAKAEMMFGIQPAMIGTAETVKTVIFKHAGCSSPAISAS